MKTWLYILSFCTVYLFAQNQAPLIVSVVSPSGNNSDSVKVPFQLADAENDICTLAVSYSSDNGSTWLAATVTNKIFQSNNPVHDTVIWVSLNDLGVRDCDKISLKLTPYDADTGTAVFTAVFALQNFTLYDFSRFFAKTAIDSLGFTHDSTITGSGACVYTYTAANANVNKLELAYSIDKGTYWLTGSSDIITNHPASKKDTITWNSLTDLAGYAGSNILLKVAAQDLTTGRIGLAAPTEMIRIDNDPPSFFWACGITDTNIVLLNFPYDIDSTKVLDTLRYTMNFGRKITAVYSNSSVGALITIAYAVQGGPEQPDNLENLEVEYYTSNNTWVSVRTIVPGDVATWKQFKDSITAIDAFHPLFKVRFIQIECSGSGFDNYYLDDVVIAKNNAPLFSDSIPASTISSSKWAVISSVATTTSQVASAPYSLKFDGSSTRQIQTVDIITGNNGLGACGYYAETDLPLLPGVPYKITIDTLFDKTGNFSTTPVSDTFACRNDLFHPSIKLNLTSSPILSGNSRIYYQLSDPNLNVLTISGVEYKVHSGQWQNATVSGYLTNIQSGSYNRYFYWDTRKDVPDKHLYSVSLRARVNDTILEGTFDILYNLEINNNNTPSISLTKVSPLYSDTTVINYTITDNETDTVDLDIFFSSDNTNWYPAKTTGTIANITSSGYTGSFKWMTRDDVKPPAYDISGTLYCKVIPKDFALGKERIIEVPYNSSSLPVIMLSNVSGEQQDTVAISYTLYDKDNSTISLTCQYSLDTGKTWLNASTAGSLSGITPANYTGTIKWLSLSDIPGIDHYKILFRVTPFDPGMGIGATTNTFHVDNNELPTSYMFPGPAGTQMTEVPVKIILSDAELDTLNLQFEFRRATSSVWSTAYMKESLYNIPSSQYNGKTLSFTWRASSNVNYYADSLWIRMRARDRDYGLKSNIIGFYYSDKGPALSIHPISNEQSGDVPVRFDITGNSLDSITINGFYDTENSSWTEATFSGTLKYGPHDDSGCVVWKSRDDVGNIDYNKARFRLRGTSHKTGSNAYSNYFTLDNNRSPLTDLLANPVVTIDKVYLKGVFTDYEFDPLRVSFQYLQASDSTWKNATLDNVIGILDSAEYDNDTIDVIWKSKSDLPLYTDTMLVRLVAIDTDTGMWDTVGFHLGQQAPDINLYYILSEQSDTVRLPYRIMYEGKDTVTMDVEYSTDNSSWHTASLTETPLFIWPTSKQDTLVWLSNVDLPHVDLPKVWIRVKPVAKFEGVWKKCNPFPLDNNLPPTISFTEETKNLEDSIVSIATDISFAVADSESDTITNSCVYRVFPETSYKTYTLPDELTTVTADNYEDSSFSFNYSFDKYGDSIGVEFILSCLDKDRGNYDTVSLMFRRFLGDFNCNGYVDLEDLEIFAQAWKNDDHSKNTGPIEGTFPNITIIQDDLFDLEDLSAFVISWNYSRKCAQKQLGDETRKQDLIFKADRKIFQSPNTDNFDISRITVKETGLNSYVIKIILPDNNLLSQGLLLSFPQNGSIDSATGVTGDFTTTCFNSNNTEVLLYSTAPLSDYTAAQQTAKIYVELKNSESPTPVHFRFRGLSKQNTFINEAACIQFNDISIENNDPAGSITYTVVPNPFTPDFSPFPQDIQSYSGKRNGTMILVKKPEDAISNDHYFTQGTISIFDVLGNTVLKGITLSTDNSGNLFFTWNGYNRNNRIVGSGTYKAVIVTEDSINGSLTHEILIGVKR